MWGTSIPSYDTALVQIHDSHRQQVGGIPNLSFLIATRRASDEPMSHTEEDTSVILVRVMDSAPLPNDSEAQRIRVESAQRVAGEIEKALGWTRSDGRPHGESSVVRGHSVSRCRHLLC